MQLFAHREPIIIQEEDSIVVLVLISLSFLFFPASEDDSKASRFLLAEDCTAESLRPVTEALQGSVTFNLCMCLNLHQLSYMTAEALKIEIGFREKMAAEILWSVLDEAVKFGRVYVTTDRV
ncbi:hypothetical protein OSB04_011591 [Centaurea solstitialis]|uniref:Uncharacterized protein n=1 Tax=Centaurea solstitialis TaxID=347529 RepID=A0AA38TST5_9ASTR|nr:hypothetical protein OSB04_011591 [Centaurea solstitialis]